MFDLAADCEDLARRARVASQALANSAEIRKNLWLEKTAAAIGDRQAQILEANEHDITSAKTHNLSSAQIDRLQLTPARLQAAAEGLRQIASLPDPVGRIMDSSVRPNGLVIQKVGVPLGVIFFIYESRPNVTLDTAGLCVKSGNAVILRGGSEALHSNTTLVEILRESLHATELPDDAVQLVSNPDRAAVGHLLRLNQWIDLTIPRGGEELIRRVAEEARMPVLKHYKGNCHVYVDQSADLQMAER